MDTLIPDSTIKRMLGLSSVSLHRWDKDPSVGFPPPIYIRNRKFRDSVAFEEWRQRKIAQAAADQGLMREKRQQSMAHAREKQAEYRKARRKRKAA